MKILIVDDEVFSRMKLQKIMQGLGECETAENGEDALKMAISENPPDLILLDILMPGIDGYEVLEKLKEAPQTKGVPVIFLSALEEKEAVIRGLELGAVDYISKPFNKEEVKARAKTHLLLKEKTETLRQKDLQLMEMDRLAGISTLSAGIAHEINNPAMMIAANLRNLEASWPVIKESLESARGRAPSKEIDYALDDIPKITEGTRGGVDRIKKIVNNLRVFSVQETSPAGKMDVNQAIEDALEVLATPDDQDVAFQKELGEIPLLVCSQSEINQCLLHVLKNAMDAVTHRGAITINTSHDTKKDRIIIRIADNGTGMSEEVLNQALNIFFTTKPVGSGQGVGLSVTERILKRHNGAINITSNEGEGTTVTMTIPVVAAIPLLKNKETS